MKKIICKMFGHDLRITRWEGIGDEKWLHQFICKRCNMIQDNIVEKVTFWRRVDDFAD